MQTIRSDNYITIQGWMVSELGLKNTELLVYAVIYGFSQDGHGCFRGTIGYLMEWTQASRQTVINALKALMQRRLIDRDEVPLLNGQRGFEYYAIMRKDGGSRKDQRGPESDRGIVENVDNSASNVENPLESAADGGIEIRGGVQKLYGGGTKIIRGVSKNYTGGVQKLDTDNKYNNYNYTIGDKNTLSAAADGESVSAEDENVLLGIDELQDEFEQTWKLYPRKEGKEQARRAYVHHRRSGVSLKTILAGIEKYIEQIDRDQIAMRFVIQGGKWFEFKRWEDKPPEPSGISAHRGGKPPRTMAYRQRHYTTDQLKEMGIDFGEDVYEQ